MVEMIIYTYVCILLSASTTDAQQIFSANIWICLAMDYYIDGQNTQLIYFLKDSTGGGKQALKLHPGGGLFGP